MWDLQVGYPSVVGIHVTRDVGPRKVESAFGLLRNSMKAIRRSRSQLCKLLHPRQEEC